MQIDVNSSCNLFYISFKQQLDSKVHLLRVLDKMKFSSGSLFVRRFGFGFWTHWNTNVQFYEEL